MASGADPVRLTNVSTGHVRPQDTAGNAEQAPHSKDMVLTDEEKEVMKECKRGSFKRAMPLSMGAMLAVQMLVRSGKWKGHPTLGATRKMMIVGGFSYIAGYMSYWPICQNKILEKIPNSNLASHVRKAKGLPDTEDQRQGDFPVSGMGNPGDGYSSIDSSSPHEGPASSDLDDRFRPSMDREVKADKDSSEGSQPRTSYEDLRRRNRQHFEDSGTQKPPASAPKDNFLPPTPQEPQKKKRTNIWGDPIDD